MAFKNDEQRIASFKHLYNIAQTSPGLSPAAEILETGHQIYSGDLLTLQLPQQEEQMQL